MQQTPYVAGQRWREYRRTTDALRKRVVLQKIEEEKKKAAMSIETAPTLYNIPVVPISVQPGTTSMMVAQILQKQEKVEDDVYIDKCAPAAIYTLNLIHQTVKELRAKPRLIVVSVLRWLADGDVIRHYRYHCDDGTHVPIAMATGSCSFDVRVYGENR